MSHKNIYYQIYKNHEDKSLPFTNLLLLHGFMGSTLDWQNLINFLLFNFKKPLKIISILLPGHTQKIDNALDNGLLKKDFSAISNPIDETNNSIYKLSKQILEIQKKEEVLNCTYLAYSMGARMAMQLANLNKQTQSLILESSFIYWKNKNSQNTKKENDLNLFKNTLDKPNLLIKKYFKKFLSNWYQLNLFDDLTQSADFANFLKNRLQQDPKQLHKALQAYSSYTIDSYLNILKNLNCPIFYIYGSKDTKYKDIALDLKKNISNITLHEIKNAGHNTHFQSSLKFNKVIFDLLN